MGIIQFNKSKNFDYFILVVRFLLAVIFISYGYSKLTDSQFGLTNEELSKPINDLDLFRIGWYLFDQQPFKYFIGVTQIICGILLLFKRTVLIGAILFLPIAINILVIDLTIMPKSLKTAFAIRLGFYILLDFLIFYHYKMQVVEAIKNLTKSTGIIHKHKLWTYIFIPIFALILEFSSAIPKLIWGLLTEPMKMINDITEMLKVIFK